MKELYHFLSKVCALEIKTREQLSRYEDLYADVFLAIDHFISHTVFRSHKNIDRLHELRKLGVDLEDVHYDALVRCIEKLDLILANDLDHIVPYCYTVVNHCLIDAFRNTIKEREMIVFLNETLNRHENDGSKRIKTLEDCLADQRASAETLWIAKEEVLKLFKKYSDNCDALLCMIAAKVFNDPPRDIAKVLISQGSVSKAISVYQNELSVIYGIKPDEFPSIAPEKKTGLSKILSSGSKETKPVASKISNIINRLK